MIQQDGTLLQEHKQWGFSPGNGAADITFPITFTNVNYTCISTSYDLNSNADVTAAYSGTYNSGKYPEEQERTVSRFYVKTGSNAGGRDWIAIGQQQWGFGESPYVEPTTYTYPLAYSVNVLNVVIGSVGGHESTCRINSVSKDSFVAYRHFSGSGKGSGYLYWLAIGV